jgi:glucokinase
VRFPGPVLVADIGGTNARFAALPEGGGRPSAAVRLRTGDYGTLAQAVGAAVTRGLPQPRSLLVAAAGPLAGRTCRLTNAGAPGRPLLLDGPDTLRALDLADGLLLNDFEALALALPSLGADDVLVVGGGAFRASAPRVVVGAGTGLGVAALLPTPAGPLPVASEGGHAALSLDGLAAAALRGTLAAGGSRLSAEDLLSGRGLARLADSVVRSRHLELPFRTPEVVTTQALARAEPTAVQAVELFLELLGAFAADAALMFCATGGVYVGGGIAPRFAGWLRDSRFRQAFEARPPAQTLLAGIGTALVTTEDAALLGLAALAAAPGRFAFDVEGRRWRNP